MVWWKTLLLQISYTEWMGDCSIMATSVMGIPFTDGPPRLGSMSRRPSVPTRDMHGDVWKGFGLSDNTCMLFRRSGDNTKWP